MNLTTLTNVKNYLSITNTNSDVILNRLVASLSSMAMSYMQRPSFALTTYNEYHSGVGNRKIMLRNWPAISVSAVQISQASYGSGGSMFGQSGLLSPPQNIPPSPSWGQAGFSLQPFDSTTAGAPQNVTLSGYAFPRGIDNVLITYQAGYCVQNELQTVPATPAYVITPSQVNGSWSGDNGVTYKSNGVALTAVSSAPSVGQYIPPTYGTNSTYTFAAADEGQQMLINYNYVPFDLENAVIDMIGERFRYMSRIGEQSHSVGGQVTTSFIVKALTDFDKLALDPYRKSFPL